ncbi:MAG: FAD-dependent oxidoreductase [Bacteroidota bacterium]|nr:FAD-dependent oxidoreductase [Bacteroidota bacterium]
MKKRQIVVVGGIAAGTSAAAKAARFNPHAEVILLEQSETISYGVCEIPYLIAGEIKEEEKLVIFSPEKFSRQKGVTVKTLHKVEKIIPNKRKLVVRDLNKSELKEFSYDKLIITTGASPKKLNIAGEDSGNVFPVRWRDGAKKILKYLETENPKKIAIIGGGLVGVEMAEAFKKLEKEVTLIHQFSLPLEILEDETRECVLKELTANGVNFIGNAKTEAFITSPKGKVEYVITNKGTFETDLVIVAIGVDPNVALAKTAGLRLGKTGAIFVNNLQRTSNDNIFAAGDCCEVKNIVNGKMSYIPLATIAARAGRVAGENAAGGNTKFDGAIYSVAVRVFNLEIARVGLSSAEALQIYKIVTETIVSDSKIPFMPGNKKITLKLIIDQISKRIIGANIYGEAGAALRANTLAIAIQNKMTINDLAHSDLIYSPPFAPLWDPILVAANQVIKKL